LEQTRHSLDEAEDCFQADLHDQVQAMNTALSSKAYLFGVCLKISFERHLDIVMKSRKSEEDFERSSSFMVDEATRLFEKVCLSSVFDVTTGLSEQERAISRLRDQHREIFHKLEEAKLRELQPPQPS
jgi:hypothetical protein